MGRLIRRLVWSGSPKSGARADYGLRVNLEKQAKSTVVTRKDSGQQLEYAASMVGGILDQGT
jgi:hypothetical protein